MRGNDTQRGAKARDDGATRNVARSSQGPGLRKRPWLLALAATLVALWIGFLAVMAWHG